LIVLHPDQITGRILEISIAIHREIGGGLLESVYEAILEYELRAHGFKVLRQQSIAFRYGGVTFEEGFRSDLLVEDTVVVEVKSVTNISPGISRQLTSYLRLMDLRVGLIINFGQPTLLAGVKRIVNRMPSFSHSRVRINRSHPPITTTHEEHTGTLEREPNLPAPPA
jgi:iron complex transport system substrate-binding protein